MESVRQILLIGRTGAGKTSFIKKYVNKNKGDYDIVYVFTTTPDEYKTMTCTANIMALDKLGPTVNQMIKKNDKRRRLVLIDNYIGICDLDDTVLMLFTQGRHKLISVCVLSQYLFKIKPCIRTNASHMFIFKSNIRDYDALFEYQDEYTNKQEFLTYMTQNTQDYNPVLIKNFVDIGSHEPSVIKIRD